MYIDVGKIKNLSDYTIKPIILYNNDYNLNETNFKNIKSAIEEIKIEILNLEDTKFDKTKLNEIYNNLQIIYCWPTIPIFNNSLTYNELKEKNQKIDENGEEIKNLKKEIEKYKMENDQFKLEIEKYKMENDQIKTEIKKYKMENDEFKMKTEKYMKENNEYKIETKKNKNDILYLKEMIENLKYENGRKPFNPYYNKRFNKRNNNRYNNYKYYNNKPNYYNSYFLKYNDVNNVNKKIM